MTLKITDDIAAARRVARRLESRGWYLDRGNAREEYVRAVARALRSRRPLHVLAGGGIGCGSTREERAGALADWAQASGRGRPR